MSVAEIICSVIFGALVVLGVLAHLEDERAGRADAFQIDPPAPQASATDEVVDQKPPNPVADPDAASEPLGDEAVTSAPRTGARAAQHRHTYGRVLLPSRNARRRHWH